MKKWNCNFISILLSNFATWATILEQNCIKKSVSLKSVMVKTKFVNMMWCVKNYCQVPNHNQSINLFFLHKPTNKFRCHFLKKKSRASKSWKKTKETWKSAIKLLRQGITVLFIGSFVIMIYLQSAIVCFNLWEFKCLL